MRDNARVISKTTIITSYYLFARSFGCSTGLHAGSAPRHKTEHSDNGEEDEGER